MIFVEHNGKKWEVDDLGFRIDGDIQPDDDWYDYVRIKEGLPELTPAHREILKYIQEYYRNNGIAPLPRNMLKDFNMSYSDLPKLFPVKNPFKTMWIMAGLPVPIT